MSLKRNMILQPATETEKKKSALYGQLFYRPPCMGFLRTELKSGAESGQALPTEVAMSRQPGGGWLTGSLPVCMILHHLSRMLGGDRA
jgi:hypothetical protein